MLRPFVLHFVVVLAIWALVVHYIDGNDFNITERRPSVTLAGGTIIRPSLYVPLQSDVTTFLSSALQALDIATTAWAASLCWRVAFFLMEKPGLRLQDLDHIISRGCFKPARKDHNNVIMGLILLVTLPLQKVVRPILSGAISWVPSHRLIEPLSDVTVSIPVASSEWWDDYAGDPIRQLWTARQATGLASLAWGRNAETGVIMKRVLRSTDGLNINSTVANVTLPYFSVTALEWISDPLNSLSPDQLNVTKIREDIGTFEGSSPIAVRGMCAFIPDSPRNATSFPSPSAISETRTLILYTHWLPGITCRPDNSEMFSGLPTNLRFLRDGSICYAFARVTYSAGVGECTNCRLSTHLTVQNDTSISLQRDAMTTTALQLMPVSSVLLVQMNTSIPSTHGPINDYVMGLLARSYSGSWTALTDFLGRPSAALDSGISASLPSVQGQVDLKRAYIWLTMQLLVTSSGVIFLLMQSRTQYGLIGDTTLAAFKLDTTDETLINEFDKLEGRGLLKLQGLDSFGRQEKLPKRDSRVYQIKSPLLQQEGGRLKVVVETVELRTPATPHP